MLKRKGAVPETLVNVYTFLDDVRAVKSTECLLPTEERRESLWNLLRIYNQINRGVSNMVTTEVVVV